MKTIAFRYGLLDPLNWDQDCHEHLFLMNRLWNTLVEIDRAHRDCYREIIGSDDAVAPLQQSLDELRSRQAELRNQRKAKRQAARARVATPEIDDELRSLAMQIQELTQQIKAAKAEAKARVKPLIDALNSEHFEAVKAARQEATWGGPEGRAIMLRIADLKEERNRILQNVCSCT